jgi:hypothetical protein
MSEAFTDWSQTPGALIRNRGLVPSTAAADRAQEIASPERIAARRSFDHAWGQSGVLAVQRQLAERGWTGEWVNVPGPLVPPELAPLGISAKAGQTTQAVFVPDGQGGMRPGNAAAEQVMQDQAAKSAAARAQLDRPRDGRHYPGDITRTVAGDRPADAAWWD